MPSKRTVLSVKGALKKDNLKRAKRLKVRQDRKTKGREILARAAEAVKGLWEQK